MQDKTPISDRLSLENIERMANQVLQEIPREFARHLGTVAIHIHDLPDEATCEEMGLEQPMELLGLYQGVSLESKSVHDLPEDLDHVYLYRLPLLAYWQEQGGRLEDHVRETLLHEIGHHFGFSDAAMERISAQVRAATESG